MTIFLFSLESAGVRRKLRQPTRAQVQALHPHPAVRGGLCKSRCCCLPCTHFDVMLFMHYLNPLFYN